MTEKLLKLLLSFLPSVRKVSMVEREVTVNSTGNCDSMSPLLGPVQHNCNSALLLDTRWETTTIVAIFKCRDEPRDHIFQTHEMLAVVEKRNVHMCRFALHKNS